MKFFVSTKSRNFIFKIKIYFYKKGTIIANIFVLSCFKMLDYNEKNEKSYVYETT
ncbi:MAG: hypothetical protein RL757_2658, partial [Bacteroidota bacterium]